MKIRAVRKHIILSCLTVQELNLGQSADKTFVGFGSMERERNAFGNILVFHGVGHPGVPVFHGDCSFHCPEIKV